MIFKYQQATNSLHKEHDGDGRHKTPVNAAKQPFVQSSHLRFVEITERFESGLDRRRRNCLARRNDNVDFFDRHVVSLFGGHDEEGRLFGEEKPGDFEWKAACLDELSDDCQTSRCPLVLFLHYHAVLHTFCRCLVAKGVGAATCHHMESPWGVPARVVCQRARSWAILGRKRSKRVPWQGFCYRDSAYADAVSFATEEEEPRM
jgi:hypothetical protein